MCRSKGTGQDKTADDQLQALVPARLRRIGGREPFQKRPGSRLGVFAAEERPLLSPLPAVRLGSGVHADAVMDRIVHNTIWVDTGTHNMREHAAASQ